MRKLYLKIVLAIWAVMISTAFGAVIMVGSLVPDDPRPNDRMRRSFDFMAEVVASEAEEQNRGAGQQGLVSWFENDLMARRIAGLTLRDENGVVLLQRGDTEADDPDRLRSRAIFEHDGRAYNLVVMPPSSAELSQLHGVRKTIGALVRHPGYRWLLLLFAVSLSIVLSVLLARYLVRPLAAFEAAGRRLAAGNLAVRVASELGNRGDEIAEFAATFDQMASRIELLVQSHKELLRDVSHELRSPLARAHAALSLARQQTDGAVDDELDRIEREIEQLNAMIEKLLVYSRLDTNQFQLQMKTTELIDFLHELLSDAQFEADVDGKSLVFTKSDSVKLLADTELLSSAFQNILRNAVRHTPASDRVEVSVRRSDANPNYCIVTIRDHGKGVDDSELEKIFLPFYKSAAGSDVNITGSGIGLAIARQAINVHGGTITAENADDGGLAIIVTLPVSNTLH